MPRILAQSGLDASIMGLARISSGLYNRVMFMLWRAIMLLAGFLCGDPGRSLAAEPVVLEVHTESTGGVRATATILFPVEPAIIQRLLTDYAHWPELFDTRMRMAEIREQDGTVLTDIRIEHALLPGERRLLSESRTLPSGGLLTELKGGDFDQYRRFWKLLPVDSGAHTKAEFELLVEIQTVVPDWMVAVAMRRELETHFARVREKGLALATQGK